MTPLVVCAKCFLWPIVIFIGEHNPTKHFILSKKKKNVFSFSNHMASRLFLNCYWIKVFLLLQTTTLTKKKKSKTLWSPFLCIKLTKPKSYWHIIKGSVIYFPSIAYLWGSENSGNTPLGHIREKYVRSGSRWQDLVALKAQCYIGELHPKKLGQALGWAQDD